MISSLVLLVLLIIPFVDGQFIMSHCYQTPATCANVANPCSQSPTCPIAPQALCYPNYCLGTACGVTQYFVSNPLFTAAEPIQGCPMILAQGSPSYASPASLQPVVSSNGYMPGYINGQFTYQYPNNYQNGQYQYPGYQAGYPSNGYYGGYAGYVPVQTTQPSQQQCSDLISKVLGPATGGLEFAYS